jgi:hypothetical protein
MGCCEGYCKKCHGMIWGLIGVLILINLFVWPQWLGIDGWLGFFALLMIIGGIWRSLKPTCGCPESVCCKEDTPVKESKKKK